MLEFAEKKAVVSGATRGIGRAITLGLLHQGASVIGLYGGDKASAEAMRAECAEFGERFSLSQLDVSDYEAVSAFFGGLESSWQTLDILVNNAGVRRDAILPLMKEADWRRVIDVNLTGGYNMCKFAVPLMLQQKYGRILFVTSPMGHLGFAGQTNYAASKAGQVGLMKSLCKEVAKRKITVNCVSPGFIATDFIGDLPEAQAREYRKMVPAGRFGTAQEVAEAALFLLSDRAAYINGAVLEITGGL